MNIRIVPASFVIGVFLLLCTFVLSNAWHDHQQLQQLLRVTGSASKNIDSDFAVFSGSLGASASTTQAAFKDLERQRPILLSFFAQKGFAEDKVEFQPPTRETVWEYNDKGHRTGKVIFQVYRQRFEIRSSDVMKIKELSVQAAALVERQVYVDIYSPQYFYTKLAQVKVEVQALAASDAMRRAKEIAGATDSQIGPLKTARMGVIQITPRHSTQVSDYGSNDTSAIEKKITAVVQAQFSID